MAYNPTVTSVSGTSVINVSSSQSALRITQLGSGEAIRVEDSTNPDTTPFVVTADGNVGILTSAPTQALQVNGAILTNAAGFVKSSASLTADNQEVTVGTSSYIEITSNSTSAGARTFTLSNGVYTGQLLFVQLTGSTTTVVADLTDTGNLRLSAAWSGTGDDTITLIWTGTHWAEISRSNN